MKYKLTVEEQETLINCDYKDRKVLIYTSRPSVYNKLVKVLGKPDNGDVTGADWYISFDDRESIRKGINISTLLPRKRRNK